MLGLTTDILRRFTIQSLYLESKHVQDMLAMLSQDGANPDTFSAINLASSFNQLFLDEKSTELLINTRKGLLKSKRLCFG